MMRGHRGTLPQGPWDLIQTAILHTPLKEVFSTVLRADHIKLWGEWGP
jgi:hypothetical protein